MTKLLLTVTLLSSFGLYAFAQTADSYPRKRIIATEQFELAADNVNFVRGRRTGIEVEASGNVVIKLKDTRISADSAVWHRATNRIDLNDGTVRIQFPLWGPP